MSKFSAYCAALTPAHTSQAESLTAASDDQISSLFRDAFESLTSSSSSSSSSSALELPLICHYMKGPYEVIIKGGNPLPLTFTEEDFEKIKKTVMNDLKMFSPLPASAINALPQYMIMYIQFKLSEAATNADTGSVKKHESGDSGVATLEGLQWKMGVVGAASDESDCKKGLVTLNLATRKNGVKKDVEFEMTVDELSKLKNKLTTVRQQIALA
ncbi:hypothetical protein TrST_g2856 [Triparma strigata]|uniref:COMM domain-containing protein n=1 Tax=Triparma strigata TaxID=1606541 RepID=A0A9W7DU55_9STRA|nr:hypothetical protein TrST_g2856 [Triparma strigata]